MVMFKWIFTIVLSLCIISSSLAMIFMLRHFAEIGENRSIWYDIMQFGDLIVLVLSIVFLIYLWSNEPRIFIPRIILPVPFTLVQYLFK